MGTPKKPHLRVIKTGKVIKVGNREGDAPVYNTPKGTQSTSLIFTPQGVKKSEFDGLHKKDENK